MNLRDWTKQYVKNKDLILRKLVDFEEGEESIIFHFKDKDVEYLIDENLGPKTISFISRKGQKMVVCIANKKNLDFLTTKWNKLKVVSDLSLVFADVNNTNKWVINPFVHSRICDEDALKKGLKSMYDNTF